MPPSKPYDTYKLRHFTGQVGDPDQSFFGSIWVSRQAKFRKVSVSDFRTWLRVGEDDGTDGDGDLNHAWPRDRDESLPGDHATNGVGFDDETLFNTEKPGWLSVVKYVRFETDHLQAYLDALQRHSEAVLSQDPASETETRHILDRAELMRQYTGIVLTYLDDHLLTNIRAPINAMTNLWETDDNCEETLPALAPLERRTERLIDPGPPVAGHSLEQFREVRCIYSARRALNLHVRLKYDEALPEYLSGYSRLQQLRTSFDTVRNKAATALPNSRPKTLTEVSESPLKPMDDESRSDLRLRVKSSLKDLELMLAIYKITDKAYYNKSVTTLLAESLQRNIRSQLSDFASHMNKATSASTEDPPGSVKSKKSSRRKKKKKKKSSPVMLTTDEALHSPNATSNGSEAEQTQGQPVCSVSNVSDDEAASKSHEEDSPHCETSEPSESVSASQEVTESPDSAPLTWADIVKRARDTTTADSEMAGSLNPTAKVRSKYRL